jgi:hypothetical protein
MYVKVKGLLEWEELALLAQTLDEACTRQDLIKISGMWSVHGARREKEHIHEVEAREPTSSETNLQERDKKIRMMRKIIIDQGPWYASEFRVQGQELCGLVL